MSGGPVGTHQTSPSADSTPFSFACRCLNVKIDGRVATSDEGILSSGGQDGTTKIEVYLPNGCEGIRLGDYMTFAQDAMSGRDLQSEVEQGKQQKNEAAEEEWVTVDLKSGIIYGEEKERSLGNEGLPFSGLLLPLPHGESTFGRPPTNPHLSTNPDSYLPSADASDKHFIIPPHDPFFLPPPFLPSHPTLKDLCDGAEAYVREQHQKLENEVRHYISIKTMELRDMEEKVRGEVEFMWEKHQSVSRKSDSFARQRSSSTSESRKGHHSETIIPPPKESKSIPQKSFQPSPHTVNPILQSATSPATSAMPNGASLLAQSLSQGSFFPAPSGVPVGGQGHHANARERDDINDTINQVAQNYGKKDDSRAVAMSYVFSTLADNMESSPARDHSPEQGVDTHNKDSWIDEETANPRMMKREDDQLSVVDEEGEGEGRTPRPRGPKKLYEENKAEGKKGKGRVTFEEPEKPEQEKPEQDTPKEAIDALEDDYVFDFELEDKPLAPVEISRSSISHLPPHHAAPPRERNMLEANLSHTFAADLPSHRAAWRSIEQNGSMYETLRRDRRDYSGDTDAEEGKISKLATSVPIAINPIRGGKASVPVTFERKTSLSDRQGILVPPLKTAMRQHSKNLSLPEVPPSRGRANSKHRQSRDSASVSRDREGLKSYAADPGPIFESLGDSAPDEDTEGEGETGGNSKGKAFVPPHVFARREQMKEDSKGVPDVGWRSMAS